MRLCTLLGVCWLATAAQTAAPQEHSANQARSAKFLAARSVAPSTGGSAAEAYQRTRQQQAQLHPLNTSLSAAWQPLGPASILSATYGNLTGRVTALALDSHDATGNTLYAGTTGGGVWKSTNAAGPLASVIFTPLTDTLPVFSQSAGSSTVPSLSIGALAVQPLANPVVLAGTGDPNDATDSLYGEGLLRSTDGGATWTLLQISHDGANGNHSFNGLATAGLAWSTANTSLVVAAFSTSPESALVGATNTASVPGLYYSTDAGVTWQMATLYDGATVVQTPQPLGTGQIGNAATAVVWDALRGSFYAAVRGHGYYASSDGANWHRLTAQPGTGLTTANCPVGANGAGSATCPIFRGALAVQPLTGDLYALTVDANNLDQGLWQDLCNATASACATTAPTFANRIDNGALETGNGSTAIVQGNYNLTLSAAPASANGTLLFAGTVDLYRCTLSANASACALRNTTNALNGCATPAAVAPAQHALATLAQASGTPLLFLGNDGGLWRSLDGVAETGSVCSASDHTHFDNLNTALGSLAEIVGFAQSPTDANVLIAGLGANGSAATANAAALTAWPQLAAGEGGYPSFDATTPANWYAAIGAGVNLKQCALGTACTAINFAGAATVGEAQVSNDASLLDAPTLLDPTLTTNLLAATCRVWRGPAGSGATWSAANAISAAFGGGATPCTAASPLVRSLAAGGPAGVSSNAQNAGAEVLYAGLAGAYDGGTLALGGHVFFTKSANTASNTAAWADIANSPVTNDSSNAGVFNPDAFDVSSLAVDPHDATGATVYATIMGFGANSIVPHLYRSTDFGTHWLNLTSNLVPAPANAIVIDPNDANTVYVATDAGVYVTQAITTCATSSCWNLLGTGLPNAPVTALAAAANLPTGDGRTGMLRAGTYGRGLWQTPLLTAISTAAPALTLSATSLTFASQQAGTQSAAQTVTLTSSGNAPVIFGTPAISGDFTETDTCAGKTLAVNATCTVAVVFAPSIAGTRTGLLTIYANIIGGQATVALTGTATAAAAVTLTPLSLVFPATLVNQTAAAQIISVANTSSTGAMLQTPVVTGDFSLAASTCGATLAASTSCSLSVTFTPTANDTRSGTLSLTDSAGTQTASLTGMGNAPATDMLAPAALTFAGQTLNTASAAQQVTLTNAGDVALTLITAVSSSAEFAATNNCGATLAGRASCAISVVFAPIATGTRSATLTVSDQFRAQTVPLTGVGVAPAGVSLSPAAQDFGAIGLGLTSAAQTLTLTNNGGVVVTISSMTATGDFVLAGTTCGASLAIGSACTATLVFTPTATGTRNGSLLLTDNAPGGTQFATLTGVGVDFTLAANGPTSATISGTNGSATFPLLLSSLATLNSSVALSCTGAPPHATCKVTPSATTLGSTITVSAVVATGVAGVALHPSRDALPWLRETTTLLAFALPFLALRRRRFRPTLTILFTLSVLSLLSACGTGRIIPGDSSTPATPTPSGTYNVVVSASAAGVTHAVTLSVIVQ